MLKKSITIYTEKLHTKKSRNREKFHWLLYNVPSFCLSSCPARLLLVITWLILLKIPCHHKHVCVPAEVPLDRTLTQTPPVNSKKNWKQSRASFESPASLGGTSVKTAIMVCLKLMWLIRLVAWPSQDLRRQVRWNLWSAVYDKLWGQGGNACGTCRIY